jgi:branched-chain amino acid transport system ATP-binding protein
MGLLEVKGLRKSFGGLDALKNITLDVKQNEILGLIGPNGAGKSTFFNVVCGIHKPSRGKVLLKGEDITGLRPDEISKKGLARTFQLSTTFPNMSVFESVYVGCQMGSKTLLSDIFFNTYSKRNKEADLQKKVREILMFTGLEGVKNEMVANLPPGHVRFLGIAMVLALDPELLLLDEPIASLNTEETETAIDLIRKIRENGITIVIVEHNMRAIMGLSDRIIVMNFGEIIAEGVREDIVRDKNVIEAYLGAEYGIA